MTQSTEKTAPFDAFLGREGATLADVEITQFQAKNLELFKAAGLPTKRQEEWKYTDLTQLTKRSFEKAAPFEGGVSGTSAFEGLAVSTFVFVNGFYREDLSVLQDLPEGVFAGTLGTSDSIPEWARKIVLEQQRPDNHSVFALNTALMRDGFLMHVPSNVKLDKPIHFRFVQESAGAVTNPANFLRHAVVLDEEASAALIETYEGNDQHAYFNSIGTQIAVGAGASLSHVKIQKEGGLATHLATQLVSVASQGSFKGFYLNAGGDTSRNEIHGNFEGENAFIQLDGVFLGAGTQHCDNTTFVNHAVPSCNSSQVFKGVLDESSRGVYQGQIVVEKDAQHTDGRQLVKTLLLSDKAEIDAKPELKIFADDVQCAHGATAGDIDDEQLFYLRSRGIDETTARALLVEAFLAEVIDRIDAEDVARICADEVSAWLSAHGRGRKNGE